MNMNEDKRAVYLQALSTVQELILLGERYIPSGPHGAYSIIEDVMGYVNSLEHELVKLRGGYQFQASQSPTGPLLKQEDPQATYQNEAPLREALERAKAMAQIQPVGQLGGKIYPPPYPKVSL